MNKEDILKNMITDALDAIFDVFSVTKMVYEDGYIRVDGFNQCDGSSTRKYLFGDIPDDIVKEVYDKYLEEYF